MAQPIADQRLYDLYAAYLHQKADDLALIENVLGREELGNVLDLCGGYGRAASFLQMPNQRWLIVDCSPEMLNVGGRFFEGREIKPEFLCADIERQDVDVSSDFSTCLILYNSINEMENIRPAIALASSALHLGGRLLIKCIVHDASYDPTGPNVTAVTPFFTLFPNRAYGEVVTTMTSTTSAEQSIELRFVSRTRAILGRMRWRRWIHDPARIDDICNANGFDLTETFIGNEYRLYAKRRPMRD